MRKRKIEAKGMKGVSGTPIAATGSTPDAGAPRVKPSWADLALAAGVAPSAVRKFALR